MNSVQNDNYQGYTMAQQQQQTQFYTEGADGPQGSAVSGIPPVIQGSRPYVDPNATGEVDPTAYPEPKDATHKIRGRSDIIDMFCNNVNQELLIAKTFYFFFFSAFGCLFPLMAVYFKQMGMNPLQTGILIGIRPFVEFIAAPFWGSIADRFKKGKMMLLCSVGSWILFTLAIGFIQPPATACVVFNGTNHILKVPFSHPKKKRSVEQDAYFVPEETLEESPVHTLMADMPGPDLPVLPHLYHKRSLKQASPEELDEEFLKQMQDWPSSMPKPHWRRKRDTPLPEDHVIGKSPNVVHYTVNFKEFKGAEEDWLSPPFSSIVYRSSDVQKVFFLLLLVVILGEFFSCPAITLADSAVLTYLGDEADHYGRQRMFGSLGWGLSMFFVGIALDHSTAFPGHPCGPHEKERNYTICFAVFSVLMGCALITASQFKFDYLEAISSTPEEAKEPVDNGPRPWNEPRIPMQEQKSQRQKLDEAIGTIKTKIFAQTMKEMPQWFVVLREFKNLRCGAFLFVAWWMGFGIGLIFAFLFWHLQDYGGTPTVFGIASVMNHISEIFAYFFSFRLIAQIGHVKVLCIGLLGNVLRFLYISWLNNPWWVLPFEFIQGITHAAVWAACCSYIAHNTPPHLRSQSQGVLQGIHHGFGRGSGAIIGGIFINFFGTSVVFRAYGVVSLIVLAAFIFVNFYRRDVGFQPDLPPEEDPREMAEEGTALAPHGVPANPMPRALSSQKLNEGSGEAGYGTYNATNGMLDIPGGGGTNNPFVQGGGGGTTGGGGGGYNYTTQPTPLVFSDTNPFRNFFTPSSPYPNKDSPVTSPDLSPDYESIKNRFQAYNDLLSGRNELKDDSKSLKSPQHTQNLQPQLPQPVTLGHNPQPQATVNDYDW